MSHIGTFLPILQKCIVQHQTDLFHHGDWLEWRHCFEGGTVFRDFALEKFNVKEDTKDFERRRKLTPIPTYAKKEINAVKNAVAQRLPDVVRRDGSAAWQDAVKGDGRGVDMRGSSMNSYIAKQLLAELLVMGRVGVLVDAPRIQRGLSRADVPATFQPFLNRFVLESAPILIEAPADSPSDWSNVLLQSAKTDFNLMTGEQDCIVTFRYYWLDADRNNRVSVIFLNEAGDIVSDVIETDLEQIPFVSFDIGASMIAEACSYQIAMLNMISADSNYAIDANYSFLTRQRGNTGFDGGSHLKGGKGDDTVRTGSTKGLFYNKGEDQPAFISPPVAPMEASLALRKEMKLEIRDLVTSSISGLGEDGSIEAGLAFIGACLQHAEQRLWDHWTIFEESRPSRRLVPIISYPDSWSLKTDKERLEESKELLNLSAKIVGQKGKKEAAKMAVDRLYRGKLSTAQIDAMKEEIEQAPYATSDPDIILRAKKEGVASIDTAAVALGFNADEGGKARQDAVVRAAMIVAAQTDAAAGAARGNEDGSVDPDANELAREGETDGDANLRETREPGRTSDE